jgi:glycosyltransferase involved in cell wall biosynthesis
MIGYLSFMVSTSLTGSLLSKPDLVIASSPPLTVGLAGWVIGKLKRIPFFFEVRDLWPDSITASGVSKKKSFLIRSLRILSIFLYRNCDHIVVVSPAFKEEIVENWDIPREKISIITNGVETSRFKPNCSIGAINQRFDLSGKFIVSYIGNFGWAQGLRTVVEAAAHLQHDHPDIVFLFVGAGADKEKLEDLVREKNLSNVRFVSQQPREKIPGFICASEICLVPLRKADVFQTVIPSKIFEFMACARPIILSVKGQARQILEQAGAGRCVEPENALALSQAILDLYHRPEARKEMGEDGRRHVVEHFSRKRLAEKYLECLEYVLK